jgi:hypothetical protein
MPCHRKDGRIGGNEKKSADPVDEFVTRRAWPGNLEQYVSVQQSCVVGRHLERKSLRVPCVVPNRLSGPGALIPTLNHGGEEVSMARPIILGRDIQTRELIRIGDIESRSATYILGKSGFGKSAVEENIAAQAMENGHGVFFLDWHGDAIDDLLTRISMDDVSLEGLGEFFYLLTPEHETHSFGINLLSCRNLASLRERTDTYTRAYSIFYKLWSDSWGPWLQLILQNVLYSTFR